MKIHYKISGDYAACGSFLPLETTINPQEVTCKSCKKTIEWKKDMENITGKKIEEMKTNWIVGKNHPIKTVIIEDSLDDVLYDEVYILKEYDDGRVILFDTEDRVHYLLTLSVNVLTGDWED